MHRITTFTLNNIFSNSKPNGLLTKRFKQQRRPDRSHPAFWYEDYPISLIGRRQSPIHIATDQCILNNTHMHLKPELNLSYPSLFNGLQIRNPKDQSYFGWRVDIPYDFADKTVLKGGPLNHRYKLVQFHAHWGKNCSCGSEHIINGKSYSAEIHFVHWNSDLYSSARQAAIAKDGLAVIAVFLEAINDNDQCAKLETLDTISNSIEQIKYKGANMAIEKPLNILELIPQDRSYWTYLGSLTTPPLWETVTWIVFEEPIKCSKEQIDSFRKLSYYPYDVMKHFEHEYEANVEENFRPIQPLNGRKVIYVKS